MSRKLSVFGILLLIFTLSGEAQTKKSNSSIFIETGSRNNSIGLREEKTAALAATILRDVTYCQVGATALKMDIYVPANREARPAPALIYVHGGAWITGDKNEGPFLDDLPELLARGYLVFSINYRLAPLHRFPAQIEDCKCAVRSIRANAARHNIDPQRIGIFGSSAGGHLAALLALTNGISEFEGYGGYPETSSAVQAVATYFGPTDLTSSDWSFIDRIGFLTVFGTSKNWKKASPINYVNAKSPPFWIVAGDRDHLVDVQQSKAIYVKLQNFSVPSELLVIKNCDHEFEPNGGALNPSRGEVSKRLAAFFNRNLQPRALQ